MILAKAFLRPLVVSLLAAGSASAFPPAPYYTLYGTVRNQVGETLSAEGAQVILLKDELELDRTPIRTGLELNQNYEFRIRLDQMRVGSRPYTPNALQAEGVFSLAVLMNGALFYPIEVQGSLQAGSGGERIRLDLTLGSDTDGDGLPDMWKKWQLYQAGYLPGANGWDLSLISAGGDLDGDGQSNLFEYRAGTSAGDATDRFELVVKEVIGSQVRLEFYAVAGKSYTLMHSQDLKNWQRVNFATSPNADADIGYVASQSRLRSAYVNDDADTETFYRLEVQ